MSTKIFYYEIPHFGRTSPRLKYGDPPNETSAEGRRFKIMNLHELTPEQVEWSISDLYAHFNPDSGAEPAPAPLPKPPQGDGTGAEAPLEEKAERKLT